MSLLGHHSVGELRDWLAAIDYQGSQIAAAFAAFGPTWQAQDPAASHAWEADWKALQARYSVAHAKAKMAIVKAALEPLPDSTIPAEDEWQGVLRALSAAPGAVSHGDFQDLYNRLTTAQGKPVDFSQMPQPKATDVDLAVYKAADATVRAGEAAVRALPVAKVGAGALVLLTGAIVAGVAGVLIASRLTPGVPR